MGRAAGEPGAFIVSVRGRVRAVVGPHVPISVKLNSADFQRGGFDFDESLQVAKWLEAASVDLIEISGGTYEQPTCSILKGWSLWRRSLWQPRRVREKRVLSILRSYAS